MTQEQDIIVEEYMAKNDNGQEAMNAMWLAEEMWEQHCAIMQAKSEMVKLSGSLQSNLYMFQFGTYMMEFCRAMMEYIWLPHDVVKSVTEHLNEKIDGYQYLPEKFESFHNQTRDYIRVQSVYIKVKDYIDNEVCYPVSHPNNKIEAEALTAILNHANKAGHDAVTRLSA
jgi:hypothetical protein